MIRRILVLLIFYSPSLVIAQTSSYKGINWITGLSWEQVKAKAKQKNKYIFVDCYATWCGPCKYMDKSVYPNDTVGSYFNEKFLSVKVQMDTTRFDNDSIKEWYADAKMINTKYKVGAFPSFLFFSPNGDIVHKDVGAKRPEDFMNVGADALNPERQYYTMWEKYRQNQLDPAYMITLIHKVQYVEGDQLSAQKIANDYINHLPADSLFTQENIRLMYDFTKNSKDRGFAIFRDSSRRIREIEPKLNESNCKWVVLNIINDEEIKPYRFTKNGKPDWKRIKSNLKKYGYLGDEAFIKFKPGIIFKTEIEPVLKINSDWHRILPLIEKQNLGKNSEFVVGSTVVFYLNGVAVNHTEKNCKNLVAAATYYADSFSTFLRSGALNSWAWTIFENSNDKDELIKALGWSSRSIALDGGEPQLLDTYANLLYKLGRVEEAIEWEKKAVKAEDAVAKKNNRKSQPVFQQTVEKMQNGEKTWPGN